MDPITALGLVASVVQLIDVTLKIIQYANDAKGASNDQAKLSMEASSLLSMLLYLQSDLEQASLGDKWFAGIRSLAVRDGPLDQVQVALENIAKKIQP